MQCMDFNYARLVRLIQIPSEDMLTDGMTKPLQGALFRSLRDRVSNMA